MEKHITYIYMIFFMNMAILPKLTYKFKPIPQNVQSLFCMNWQANPKIHIKMKGPRIGYPTLKKKNKIAWLIFLDFNLTINLQ